MSEKINDPGIGTQFESKTRRIISKDGSYNIHRKGARTGIKDMFKYLVEISWWKFFLILFSSYLILNLLFTFIYMACGFENIAGIDEEAGSPHFQAFFFSIQTFTTVGYGTLAPLGVATQSVAAIEAFVGFLSFSVATGLLYGRFSRPNAKFIFSDKILYSKYQDGHSIKIKFANERDNVLLEVEAKVILTFDKVLSNGQVEKEYYRLPLELDRVELLPFTWTLVHKIDAESPFYNLTKEEIIQKNPEFLILVKGFDEIYSQHIHTKQSYGAEDLDWNKNFVKTFHPNKDGVIEMDLRNINLTEDDE